MNSKILIASILLIGGLLAITDAQGGGRNRGRNRNNNNNNNNGNCLKRLERCARRKIENNVVQKMNRMKEGMAACFATAQCLNPFCAKEKAIDFLHSNQACGLGPIPTPQEKLRFKMFMAMKKYQKIISKVISEGPPEDGPAGVFGQMNKMRMMASKMRSKIMEKAEKFCAEPDTFADCAQQVMRPIMGPKMMKLKSAVGKQFQNRGPPNSELEFRDFMVRVFLDVHENEINQCKRQMNGGCKNKPQRFQQKHIRRIGELAESHAEAMEENIRPKLVAACDCINNKLNSNDYQSIDQAIVDACPGSTPPGDLTSQVVIEMIGEKMCPKLDEDGPDDEEDDEDGFLPF